jgi:hypothetical protein
MYTENHHQNRHSRAISPRNIKIIVRCAKRIVALDKQEDRFVILKLSDKQNKIHFIIKIKKMEASA